MITDLMQSGFPHVGRAVLIRSLHCASNDDFVLRPRTSAFYLL
jgi:hypothetical protein